MVRSEKLNMCRKPAYNVDYEQKWDEEGGQVHHWLYNRNGWIQLHT